MKQKVAEILAELCGVEPEEIEPGLDLFGEGLLDSFAAIQLVMGLEETFGVPLDIASLPREKITTPEMICALLREKLG